MNKSVLYLFIIIILATSLVACNSNDKKPTKVNSKKVTEERADEEKDVNLPKIIIDKVSNSEENAANLFKAYLDYYKNNPSDSNLKLKDYKINKIEVLNSNEDTIYFNCDFSVEPAIEEAWLVANGKKDDSGWINNKFNFVTGSIKENKITLYKITTSP